MSESTGSEVITGSSRSDGKTLQSAARVPPPLVAGCADPRGPLKVPLPQADSAQAEWLK